MKAPAGPHADVPYLLLRIGLAGVLLYAGIDAFKEPAVWVSFVPAFTTHFVSTKTSLDLISAVQIAIAGLLVVGIWVRYAAAIAGLLLIGILVFNPHALIETFRDFGLVFMAAALVFWER